MRLSLMGKLAISWAVNVVFWLSIAKIAQHQSIWVYCFAILSLGFSMFLTALAISAYYEKGGKENPEVIKSIKVIIRANPLALVILCLVGITFIVHELFEEKENVLD